MMKLRKQATATMALALLALSVGGMARAVDPDPGVDLVVNGDTKIVTRAPANANIPGLTEVYSGWLFHDPTTQAMQSDDFSDPAMLSVDAGNAQWSTVMGTEGKSCASCHNGMDSMKGVRASMPKVNKAGKLWSLEDYINDCVTNRMGAKALGWNSDPMVNLTAAISMQSRGMPVNVATDGAAAPFWEKGKEMYYTRTGLLELSCANCHEQHYGDHIRDERLSQGQINGFPVYRLKTTNMVSIHNRFYGCVRDTRAESYKEGTDPLRDLELYVASRGNGLSVEGVSVRP